VFGESTWASIQAMEINFSGGLSVFKVQGEVYRFTEPLRQAEKQEPNCYGSPIRCTNTGTA